MPGVQQHYTPRWSGFHDGIGVASRGYLRQRLPGRRLRNHRVSKLRRLGRQNCVFWLIMWFSLGSSVLQPKKRPRERSHSNTSIQLRASQSPTHPDYERTNFHTKRHFPIGSRNSPAFQGRTLTGQRIILLWSLFNLLGLTSAGTTLTISVTPGIETAEHTAEHGSLLRRESSARSRGSAFYDELDDSTS